MGGNKAPAQIVKMAEVKETPTEAPQPQKAPSNSGGADRVTLSPELQVVLNRAQATPEVDQGRVDSIRSAIQQGTFQIEPQSIADKMVGN